MCNLTKRRRDLTEVTIYKLVTKEVDGRYRSYFANTPVHVGKVIPQQIPGQYIPLGFHFYKKGDGLYNRKMVGKCSGFKNPKIAKELFGYKEDENVVLEIVLGGEIWEGDSKGISMSIYDEEVTYAGTEILSIKELE